MLKPDRREFALTFGAEHVQSSQTYASDAAPSAEPEEEELALVRLGAQEDNFAVNIVDLALMAAQNNERDLELTVLDLVTGNVKTAVKVNNNVDRLESLADHFALKDRLEAKSNAHATKLCERAKARLELYHDQHQPGEGDGRHGQAGADQEVLKQCNYMLLGDCLRHYYLLQLLLLHHQIS